MNNVRVLPPRKFGPLANLWSSANDLIAEPAESSRLEVGSDTLLCLTNDDALPDGCDIQDDVDIFADEEYTLFSDAAPTEIEVPTFALFTEDVGSGLRSKAQEEDVSDAAYDKRHRKHELAEKKLKNRERERLQYERYQQQLAVDKLRSMDTDRLIPTAALRNNEARLDARETMVRKLLKEAEDRLAKYDSFGFGDRKKRSSELTGSPLESDDEYDDDFYSKPKKRRQSSRRDDDIRGSAAHNRSKGAKGGFGAKVTVSGAKSTRRSVTVRATAASERTPRQRTVPNAKPLPIPLPPPPDLTTFLKPDTAMPSGPRKSTRASLAFGVKVPSVVLRKRPFELPEEPYGEMIRSRVALRERQARRAQRTRTKSVEIPKKRKADATGSSSSSSSSVRGRSGGNGGSGARQRRASIQRASKRRRARSNSRSNSRSGGFANVSTLATGTGHSFAGGVESYAMLQHMHRGAINTSFFTDHDSFAYDDMTMAAIDNPHALDMSHYSWEVVPDDWRPAVEPEPHFVVDDSNPSGMHPLMVSDHDNSLPVHHGEVPIVLIPAMPLPDDLESPMST